MGTIEGDLHDIGKNIFKSMAEAAGFEVFNLDPANRDMMATILATEALLGWDRHCRNFSNAFRKNKIGPINQ